MKKILIQLKKIVNHKHFYLLALGVFLLIGIFLRTYEHHDWLRFNADQGRDAAVISGFIDGDLKLPLLGPKAGGTEFKLGPVFYYFQIVSAKIFGDAPDKMAYPDLLTGILCIPLLFFFLRKFFEKNAALALTAIFAVSSYAVSFSRFAWNPNSTPFWTMLSLFAIHEVLQEKKNAKIFWATLAGVAIGVGVQLHTTSLLFLPITTILIFGFLAFKNIKILKYFFIILTMSLLMNVPQLMGEYQTKGANVKAFLVGMQKKQATVPLISKVEQSSICFVEANVQILTGHEISDTCKLKNEAVTLLIFALGAFFVLGGLFLGIYYFRREKDVNAKSFLALIFTYCAVAVLVFVSIAFELSMRFYLVLIFLPFVLLGFWFKFILEKLKNKGFFLVVLLCVTLIGSNLFFVEKYFSKLASYSKNGGTVNVVILSQVEEFANFIVQNSNGKSAVHVEGNKKFLFKAIKPMKYLVERSGSGLTLLEKGSQQQDQYFYVARSNKKASLLKDDSVSVLSHLTHGRFTILLLQKK